MEISRKQIKKGAAFISDGGSVMDAFDTHEEFLERLLDEMDLAVEPEPILPDITQGELVITDTSPRFIKLSASNGTALYFADYHDDPRVLLPSKKEAVANAKLHAAAPELVAA